MPRLAATLILLLAAACHAATDPASDPADVPTSPAAGPVAAPAGPSYAVDAGHNAAEHFKIDQPLAFELESPCNGELIEFTGRETGQINKVGTREILDAGGFLHFEHHGRVVATGVGQTTGAAYDLVEVFHEGFESPSAPAPQFTVSIRETLHVSGSAPATSFSAQSHFHALATPAGELKVTRDIESATCGR